MAADDRRGGAASGVGAPSGVSAVKGYRTEGPIGQISKRLRDHAARRRRSRGGPRRSRRSPAFSIRLPSRQSSQGCRTLWRRCDRKIGQPRRPDHNTAVNRARAFLDTAIESSVTAEDLDRATGIDRFSLARSFRAQIGTSPHRHLIGRRLLRVRARIVGGLALAEAAVAAGFADQRRMTWHFKARFGITPGRYARLPKNGRTAGRGS
jgi:methylphosphotriester-DNA--protein-cysteine methyltransferase